MDFVGHFLLVAIIFVVIDSVWISVVANKFYKQQIGGLLKPKPDFVAAGIFYALYVSGIVFFALDPALQDESLTTAIGRGALLGLLMYATYDLTNQSVLKNWPYKMTVVDMAWGTFVTAAVTAVAYAVLS